MKSFLQFVALMAVFGYVGGYLTGWAFSDEEIRIAMCSYYTEWEFCKGIEKGERKRDLAIQGLSKRLHQLERMVVIHKRDKLCVKAYRLNIRLYPLNGKVIGIYRKGAKVEVIDRIGGWVRTKEGWVSERYLTTCSKNMDSSSGGGNRVSPPAIRLPEPPEKDKGRNRAMSSSDRITDVLKKKK